MKWFERVKAWVGRAAHNVAEWLEGKKTVLATAGATLATAYAAYRRGLDVEWTDVIILAFNFLIILFRGLARTSGFLVKDKVVYINRHDVNGDLLVR